MQQEVNEIKQLMFKVLKITPTHSAPSQLSHMTESDGPQQPHTLMAPQKMSNKESRHGRTPQQPFISQGNNFFESRQPQDRRSQFSDSRSRLSDYSQSDPRNRQKIGYPQQQDQRRGFSGSRSGYMTEPDRPAQGRPRRRRRGRGRKRSSLDGDYDSDMNSTISEQMPMLNFQPGDRSRGRRRGKGGSKLTGSWEDIRSETDA